MSDDAEESERPPVYRLYAAIVHAGGSVDGGHYYAYARRIEAGEGADDEGEWYAMDDSSVRRASLAEVRKSRRTCSSTRERRGFLRRRTPWRPSRAGGDALGRVGEGKPRGRRGGRRVRVGSLDGKRTLDGSSRDAQPSTRAAAGERSRGAGGVRSHTGQPRSRTSTSSTNAARAKRTTGPGVEPARGRWLRRRSPRRRMRHASGTELSSEIRDHPPPPRFSDSLVMTKTTKTNSGTTTRMSRSGWFAAVMGNGRLRWRNAMTRGGNGRPWRMLRTAVGDTSFGRGVRQVA